MDLSTMMSKIDLHHYQSVKEFLADIEQICLNALEYNPDKDPQSTFFIIHFKPIIYLTITFMFYFLRKENTKFYLLYILYIVTAYGHVLNIIKLKH